MVLVKHMMNFGRNFVQKCYDYMIELAARPSALYFLAAVSFIEREEFVGLVRSQKRLGVKTAVFKRFYETESKRRSRYTAVAVTV